VTHDEKKRAENGDLESYRHLCEVRDIARRYFEKGSDAIKSYLLGVEKHRGADAAQRLRAEAWEIIKDQKKVKESAKKAIYPRR